MPIAWGIQTLIDNIGMGFEWVVLMISILATLPFFAKDFKIGVITLLASSAAIFIWFYEISYNWKLPLVMFFISIILLALSLFAVQSTSNTGGFS